MITGFFKVHFSYAGQNAPKQASMAGFNKNILRKVLHRKVFLAAIVTAPVMGAVRLY
jgi:hypothetical protein